MKTMFGQTRFGRGPFGQPRARPEFSVSIGSGDVTTGTALTATITPDPAPLVPTFQWTDDGVNITGAITNPDTFSIGTDGVADASLIRVVATIDGTPYTSNARRIVYAEGSLGAFTDQTFTEGVGGTYQHPAATGTGLTWTYTATDLIEGVTYDAGTRTLTYSSSLAIQAGTRGATISASDQYGRAASGSPRAAIFTIEAAVAAVNPVITGSSFTNNASPTDDAVSVNGTYAGPDPLDGTVEFLQGATLHATASVPGLTVTAGEFAFTETIQAADLVYEPGSSSADIPNCDAIRLTIAERNNGGSATVTIPVTGLHIDGWTTSGGAGSITVTSQPTPPPSPTVTGGNGTLTITG